MMVICSPAICRGLGETHPSSSRRTPGSRDRRTLGGNQKDIKPPQPPQHGGWRLFSGIRTPCRRKARCAEARSVAAAPPRLLGPRFRGGNEGERGGAGKTRKGPGLAPISLIVFPAKAGIQGPPNPGWQPERQSPITTSAAPRILSFQDSPRIMLAVCPLPSRFRPGSGTTAAPGPPLSRGKRRGAWRSRKNSKGVCFGADLSHRFPGEGRDPGATEPWVATRRTLNHHSLRGTEGGVFFRNSYTMPAESPLH